MDEEIEYLEEYEDLVLPNLSSSSSSKTTASITTAPKRTVPLKSSAIDSDNESSSSLDQDIFDSLFDNVSDDDDDDILKKSESKKRESLDSIDALVKDLGERVAKNTAINAAAKVADKTLVQKSSTSKSFFNKPTGSLSRRPLNNDDEKSTLTNATESPSKSNLSRERNRPVATIVRPEKIITKDPAEDPLSLDDVLETNTAIKKTEMVGLSLSEMSNDSYESLETLEREVAATENLLLTPTSIVKETFKSGENSPIKKRGSSHLTTTDTSTVSSDYSIKSKLPDKVKIISNTPLHPVDKELIKSISRKQTPEISAKIIPEPEKIVESHGNEINLEDGLIGDFLDTNDYDNVLYNEVEVETQTYESNNKIDDDLEGIRQALVNNNTTIEESSGNIAHNMSEDDSHLSSQNIIDAIDKLLSPKPLCQKEANTSDHSKDRLSGTKTDLPPEKVDDEPNDRNAEVEMTAVIECQEPSSIESIEDIENIRNIAKPKKHQREPSNERIFRMPKTNNERGRKDTLNTNESSKKTDIEPTADLLSSPKKRISDPKPAIPASKSNAMAENSHSSRAQSRTPQKPAHTYTLEKSSSSSSIASDKTRESSVGSTCNDKTFETPKRRSSTCSKSSDTSVKKSMRSNEKSERKSGILRTSSSESSKSPRNISPSKSMHANREPQLRKESNKFDSPTKLHSKTSDRTHSANSSHRETKQSSETKDTNKQNNDLRTTTNKEQEENNIKKSRDKHVSSSENPHSKNKETDKSVKDLEANTSRKGIRPTSTKTSENEKSPIKHSVHEHKSEATSDTAKHRKDFKKSNETQTTQKHNVLTSASSTTKDKVKTDDTKKQLNTSLGKGRHNSSMESIKDDKKDKTKAAGGADVKRKFYETSEQISPVKSFTETKHSQTQQKNTQNNLRTASEVTSSKVNDPDTKTMTADFKDKDVSSTKREPVTNKKVELKNKSNDMHTSLATSKSKTKDENSCAIDEKDTTREEDKPNADKIDSKSTITSKYANSNKDKQKDDDQSSKSQTNKDKDKAHEVKKSNRKSRNETATSLQREKSAGSAVQTISVLKESGTPKDTAGSVKQTQNNKRATAKQHSDESVPMSDKKFTTKQQTGGTVESDRDSDIKQQNTIKREGNATDKNAEAQQDNLAMEPASLSDKNADGTQKRNISATSKPATKAKAQKTAKKTTEKSSAAVSKEEANSIENTNVAEVDVKCAPAVLAATEIKIEKVQQEQNDIPAVYSKKQQASQKEKLKRERSNAAKALKEPTAKVDETIENSAKQGNDHKHVKADAVPLGDANDKTTNEKTTVPKSENMDNQAASVGKDGELSQAVKGKHSNTSCVSIHTQQISAVGEGSNPVDNLTNTKLQSSLDKAVKTTTSKAAELHNTTPTKRNKCDEPKEEKGRVAKSEVDVTVAEIGKDISMANSETKAESNPVSITMRTSRKRGGKDEDANQVDIKKPFKEPEKPITRSRDPTPVERTVQRRSRDATPTELIIKTRARAATPTEQKSGTKSRDPTPTDFKETTRSRVVTPTEQKTAVRSRDPTPTEKVHTTRSRVATPNEEHQAAASVIDAATTLDDKSFTKKPREPNRRPSTANVADDPSTGDEKKVPEQSPVINTDETTRPIAEEKENVALEPSGGDIATNTAPAADGVEVNNPAVTSTVIVTSPGDLEFTQKCENSADFKPDESSDDKSGSDTKTTPFHIKIKKERAVANRRLRQGPIASADSTAVTTTETSAASTKETAAIQTTADVEDVCTSTSVPTEPKDSTSTAKTAANDKAKFNDSKEPTTKPSPKAAHISPKRAKHLKAPAAAAVTSTDATLTLKSPTISTRSRVTTPTFIPLPLPKRNRDKSKAKKSDKNQLFSNDKAPTQPSAPETPKSNTVVVKRNISSPIGDEDTENAEAVKKLKLEERPTTNETVATRDPIPQEAKEAPLLNASAISEGESGKAEEINKTTSIKAAAEANAAEGNAVEANAVEANANQANTVADESTVEAVNAVGKDNVVANSSEVRSEMLDEPPPAKKPKLDSENSTDEKETVTSGVEHSLAELDNSDTISACSGDEFCERTPSIDVPLLNANDKMQSTKKRLNDRRHKSEFQRLMDAIPKELKDHGIEDLIKEEAPRVRASKMATLAPTGSCARTTPTAQNRNTVYSVTTPPPAHPIKIESKRVRARQTITPTTTTVSPTTKVVTEAQTVTADQVEVFKTPSRSLYLKQRTSDPSKNTLSSKTLHETQNNCIALNKCRPFRVRINRRLFTKLAIKHGLLLAIDKLQNQNATQPVTQSLKKSPKKTEFGNKMISNSKEELSPVVNETESIVFNTHDSIKANDSPPDDSYDFGDNELSLLTPLRSKPVREEVLPPRQTKAKLPTNRDKQRKSWNAVAPTNVSAPSIKLPVAPKGHTYTSTTSKAALAAFLGTKTTQYKVTTKLVALKATSAKMPIDPVSTLVPLVPPKIEVEDPEETILPTVTPEMPKLSTRSKQATASIPPQKTAPSQAATSTASQTIPKTGLPSCNANANTNSLLSSCGGTAMYNFLYPSKYHASYGEVLLDCCCRDLGGPIPAVNPSRAHSNLEAPIRELPAYVVMTTQLVTQEELKSKKNFIPASVRQKLQRSPTQQQQQQQQLSRQQTQAQTAQQSQATKKATTGATVPTTLPLMPSTISALKKQLPSTTTITAKTVNPNMVDPEHLVRRVDSLLLKLSHLVLTATFSERQLVIEDMTMQNKYSAKDIEMVSNVLLDYEQCLQSKMVPRPIALPPVPPAHNKLPVQSTKTPGTTMNTATKFHATTPQYTYHMPQNTPVYDANNMIIGYQMTMPSKAPPYTATAPNAAMQVNTSKSSYNLPQVPQTQSTMSTNTAIMSISSNVSPMTFGTSTAKSSATSTFAQQGHGISNLHLYSTAATTTAISSTTTTSAPAITLRPPAQESPRVFYTKSASMQSATPNAASLQANSTETGAGTAAVASAAGTPTSTTATLATPGNSSKKRVRFSNDLTTTTRTTGGNNTKKTGRFSNDPPTTVADKFLRNPAVTIRKIMPKAAPIPTTTVVTATATTTSTQMATRVKQKAHQSTPSKTGNTSFVRRSLPKAPDMRQQLLSSTLNASPATAMQRNVATTAKLSQSLIEPKTITKSPSGAVITTSAAPMPALGTKSRRVTRSLPTETRQIIVVTKDSHGEPLVNYDDECILPDEPNELIKRERSDEDFIGGI